MAEKTQTTPAPAAAPTGEAPVPRAARPAASAPAQPPADRVVDVVVGIEGDAVKQSSRRIAHDEPPPLPVNKELRVIGKPTPRIDGRAKVTGAARYTADVKLPGMLYARMITSPHPCAQIKAIDT